MTYQKRLLAFVSLLIAGLAALAFAPSAAQAAPPSNCTYNYSVCGYEDANYSCNDGCEVDTSRTAGCIDPQVVYNDQWSSFYNNSGRTVRLYMDANCTGRWVQYANGVGTAYFLLTNPDFENRVSSVRFM